MALSVVNLPVEGDVFPMGVELIDVAENAPVVIDVAVNVVNDPAAGID